MYVFDPSLTLLPNTQYFFYEDAFLTLNLQTVSGTYFSSRGGAGSDFLFFTGTTNFRLSGDVVVDLFQRTLNDISAALGSGGIDNQGIASSLTEKITNAKNAPDKTTRDNIIGAFVDEVNALAGKHITQAAAALLIGDATALLGLP